MSDFNQLMTEVVDQNPGAKAAVIAKLMNDFAARGITITEADIHAQMGEFLLQAIAQVKTGG